MQAPTDINYREKAAGTYLAAQRRINNRKGFRLFLILLAIFAAAVVVLVLMVAYHL